MLWTDYIAGLSRSQAPPGTRYTYALAVRQFVDYLKQRKQSPDKPPDDALAKFTKWLAERGRSQTTIRVYLAGARSYLRWLRKHHHIRVNCSLPPEFAACRNQAAEVVPDDTLRKFVKALLETDCEQCGAVAALVVGAGLRLGELPQLRLRDLRFDGETVRVLFRNGRGDVVRVVPVLRQVVPAIRRRAEFLTQKQPVVFTARNTPVRGAGYSALRRMFLYVENAAGVRFHVDAYRRTYLRLLLQAGVAPRTAVAMLGLGTQGPIERLPNERELTAAEHAADGIMDDGKRRRR